MLAAAAACLLEIGLFWAGAARLWPPLVSVGVHLCLVGGLAAWTLRSPACRADLRVPLLLTLAVFFLGPFGAAGTLLMMLAAKRYAKSTAPFEVWYPALFPEEAGGTSEEEWSRLVTGQDDGHRTSVTPFSDILGFGSVGQKQELLAVISRHGGTKFAPILRLATSDADNGIRVQAASALARIEDEFLPREQELSAAILENPTDAQQLLKLGRLYDEYSGAGVLGADREHESREKALAAYGDYLMLSAGDVDARVAVSRLLIADGRFHDAIRHLESWVREDGSSAALLLLYMEALFRLRRFSDVRQVAAKHQRTLAQAGDVSIEAREAVKLWMGATA